MIKKRPVIAYFIVLWTCKKEEFGPGSGKQKESELVAKDDNQDDISSKDEKKKDQHNVDQNEQEDDKEPEPHNIDNQDEVGFHT